MNKTTIQNVRKGKTWLAAAPEAATPSAVGGVDRMREAIDKALGHISGGLCYFTAEAKHAQLIDAQRVLEAALASGETSPERGEG